MSNVVQFLDTLGRNPQLGSEAAYADAIAAAGIGQTAQQALLNRDADGLNRLLGGAAVVLSFLVPAEDDAPQREDGGDTDGPGSEEHHESDAKVA